MSDSDGDFSDELLELAGAGEKKHKRSQQRSAKRRKANSHSASSENEYESEDDFVNPYPLEGKYKNEEDRLQLQQLPEIEREKEIASRLEEIQRITDKRNLDRMFRAQSQRTGDSADAVSKAAKRAHNQRGATKEKSQKLDELKAKRKAKGDKKRNKPNSPKRERSSSPMDMEMSDDEDEDGQITKYEQEEEREQRLAGKAKSEDEPVTREDFMTCQLTREKLCRFAYHPWFDEYVKGAYVRYLIGDRNGEAVYRICEIVNIDPNLIRPYKIDGNAYDQQLELKQGKSLKSFPFDKVSNGPFQVKEFEWLIKTCQSEQVKLPTKRSLEKKSEHLKKLPNQSLTNKEIDFILAKKQALQQSPTISSLNATLQKQRLSQAHRFAVMRGDTEEAAELQKQLDELDKVLGASANGSAAQDVTTQDLLVMVNERNRKANLEAVRKAETETAEKKRKERKARFLAAQAQKRMQQLGQQGGSTPGTPGAVNGTPIPGGTPLLGASSTPGRSVSPMPLSSGGSSGPPAKKQRLETLMAAQVEVDLGDF